MPVLKRILLNLINFIKNSLHLVKRAQGAADSREQVRYISKEGLNSPEFELLNFEKNPPAGLSSDFSSFVSSFLAENEKVGTLLSPFSGFVGLNENLGVVDFESEFSSFFGLFGLKENRGVEVGADFTSSSDFLDINENGFGSIFTGESTFTGDSTCLVSKTDSVVGASFSSFTDWLSESVQEVPYFLILFSRIIFLKSPF